MKISVIHHILHFHQPAGTSRGVLTKKDSWFLLLTHPDQPDIIGIGECSVLPGLSPELNTNIGSILNEIENQPDVWLSNPGLSAAFPALRFALETAWLDWQTGGKRLLFPSPFTEGKQAIPINGLIWMSPPEEMRRQIRQKVEEGFTTLKMKIGALDFETELDILGFIRKTFSAQDLTLRLDANGAFAPCEALHKLERLSPYKIHSIEQPIRQGQPTSMALLCEKSPIPIALDEELIGVSSLQEKIELLDTIRPAYIILKPSLHGGFSGAEEWIKLAGARNIGWWITSALESNIGLNAIAQWAHHMDAQGVQGLGTGKLFSNNFSSPLFIAHGMLHHNPKVSWNVHLPGL
ncbi:MAG: o-succinylbenzoate synthase [Bacteroidales bacterium]